MPELPGHERREERREERHLEKLLDVNVPGGPPGFILDPDDQRGHASVPRVPDDLWDPEGDPLARGAGEDDDFIRSRTRIMPEGTVL